MVINRLNSLSFECIRFDNLQRDARTSLDYGDAPSSYVDANHTITSSPSLYLGNVVSDE